jgi:ComF family protein
MAEQPGPIGRAMRGAGTLLLDAIIPRRCGLCGRFDAFLCMQCSASLPEAAPPRCPTCWSIPGSRGACRTCATVLVHSLAGVRARYRLEDGARRLVHALKYDGLSALAAPMGALLAPTLADWAIAPDLVAPVPLHPGRERRRGFNQAALLARALAERAGLPVEARLLRRTRATAAQVRSGGVEARRANVANAFAVTDAGRARGRTVLLVDDVCTTGATLRACADALRAAGARSVYGLTFAHED